MQELERILEEIDAHAIEFEIFGASDDYISVGWAKDIIRKYMKNEKDIIKFYYCESEDDYYLGQRVQNMYYAKYEHGSFTWFMSRYLPWGTDGYPSEPKEIPLIEWIAGFIRKHMNDGWISVEKRLPKRRVRYVWITVDHGTIWQRMLAKWDGKDFKNIYGAELYCKIIAWQECKTPEPYRPERSVEE